MNAARVLLLGLGLSCIGCPPAPPAQDPVVEASAQPPVTASAAPVEVISGAASASAEAGPVVALETQAHTIDAKVKAVSPFGQKAANVFMVDADPRFVIELELLGVAPGMADDPPGSGLAAGKTVAFAVHSPAKVFKSDTDMVGKRMQFSVTRTRTKNGVTLSALQAE